MLKLRECDLPTLIEVNRVEDVLNFYFIKFEFHLLEQSYELLNVDLVRFIDVDIVKKLLLGLFVL